MSQWIGFGKGTNGYLTASASPNTYGACSGTSGSSSLTCSLSVIAGDALFIHQTQDATNYGNWEVNWVVSTSGSTITLLYPLNNTYTSSGSSKAQAVKMPQYSGVSLSGSSYLAPSKMWDGTSGGILAILVSGELTLNVSSDYRGLRVGIPDSGGSSVAYGFRGGDGIGTGGGNGRAGEGYYAESYNNQGDTSALDGAGGGTSDKQSGGAGGAGTTAGTDGGGVSKGIGGTAYLSDATLATKFTFGAGGGSGGAEFQSNSGTGGQGAGIMYICARIIRILGSNINIAAMGTIPGGSGSGSGQGAGGNGGGGAGCIFLKTQELIQTSSNQIQALGHAGSNATRPDYGNGGNGGNGRIRIEACKVTGSETTNPAASIVKGGFDFCGSIASII